MTTTFLDHNHKIHMMLNDPWQDNQSLEMLEFDDKDMFNISNDRVDRFGGDDIFNMSNEMLLPSSGFPNFLDLDMDPMKFTEQKQPHSPEQFQPPQKRLKTKTISHRQQQCLTRAFFPPTPPHKAPSLAMAPSPLFIPFDADICCASEHVIKLPAFGHDSRISILNALSTATPSLGCIQIRGQSFRILIYAFYYNIENQLQMIVLDRNGDPQPAFVLAAELQSLLDQYSAGQDQQFTKPLLPNQPLTWRNFYIYAPATLRYHNIAAAIPSPIRTLNINKPNFILLWLGNPKHPFFLQHSVQVVPSTFVTPTIKTIKTIMQYKVRENPPLPANATPWKLDAESLFDVHERRAGIEQLREMTEMLKKALSHKEELDDRTESE